LHAIEKKKCVVEILGALPGDVPAMAIRLVE
jgi:hypothetical protein